VGVNEDMSQIAAWNGKAGIIYGGSDSGWAPVSVINYPYVRGGKTDHWGGYGLANFQDVRFFEGNFWTVVTPQEMGMEPTRQEDLMPNYTVFILKDGSIWVAECDWGGPGLLEGRVFAGWIMGLKGKSRQWRLVAQRCS
jgi:hypothetical protein